MNISHVITPTSRRLVTEWRPTGRHFLNNRALVMNVNYISLAKFMLQRGFETILDCRVEMTAAEIVKLMDEWNVAEVVLPSFSANADDTFQTAKQLFALDCIPPSMICCTLQGVDLEEICMLASALTKVSNNGFHAILIPNYVREFAPWEEVVAMVSEEIHPAARIYIDGIWKSPYDEIMELRKLRRVSTLHTEAAIRLADESTPLTHQSTFTDDFLVKDVFVAKSLVSKNMEILEGWRKNEILRL